MAFVRAYEFQFGFLLLSSSSVFQLCFDYGRTFFKFSNNAKPCSVCVTLNNIPVNENHNVELQYGLQEES